MAHSLDITVDEYVQDSIEPEAITVSTTNAEISISVTEDGGIQILAYDRVDFDRVGPLT